MRVLKPSNLPHYTYNDYIHWEGRWELIDGIAHAMAPAPSIQHQRISQKIARLLDEALEHCPHCQALLPVDWKINQDTIVQPDHLVICYEPEGQYLTRAPSVIFEILSESTRNKDEKVKFRLYEMEGVSYYCIVDPEQRCVRQFALVHGRYKKSMELRADILVFRLAECEFRFDGARIWE